MQRNHSYLPIIAGFLLLSYPAYLLLSWLYISNNSENFYIAKQTYIDSLPTFLTSRYAPALLSLPLCIAAIYINKNNLRNPIWFVKLFSWLIVITAGLIAFLNLWSLM